MPRERRRLRTRPASSMRSACRRRRASAISSRSRSRSRSGSAASPSPSRCGHRGTTRSSRSGSASPRGSSLSLRAFPTISRRTRSRSTRRGFDPERLRRHFYTSSSCGVCGKGAIEAVQVDAPRVESPLAVGVDVVASLPERLREAQRAFAATGGLHATGLFDPSGDSCACARMWAAQRDGQGRRLGVLDGASRCRADPLRQRAALVRARAEGRRRRLPGARRSRRASSLAIELAEDRGVTLCGWVRDGRVTVYSEPWRIA